MDSASVSCSSLLSPMLLAAFIMAGLVSVVFTSALADAWQAEPPPAVAAAPAP